MEFIMDSFVSGLATANDANHFARAVYLGRSPSADYCPGPPLTWMLTGAPTPLLNQVYVEPMSTHEADRAIVDALGYFKSRHLGAASWWPMPGVDLAELGRLLEAHGLTFNEGRPGMALYLPAMPDASAMPKGLTIEPVTSEDMLRRWVHSCAGAFGAPVEDEPEVFDFYLGLGFDLPLRNYLGYIDGEPVGTSQLFLGGGVAGVYTVATVEWARRRGIGRSMTLAALQDARALGYRVATLQASPTAMPVYEHLGFLAVGRTSYWEWYETPQ